MRIYLDGNVESLDHEPRTLDQLLEQFRLQGKLGGRVVKSITINGHEVYAEDHVNVALSNTDEVKVATQSVSQVLTATAETAAEYLPRLAAGCRAVAQRMYQGEVSGAFGMMPEILDGLEWLVTVLRHVANLCPQHRGSALSELDAITRGLSQVSEAWEARDHTLMADLLEYEVAPRLDHAGRWVGDVARELRGT